MLKRLVKICSVFWGIDDSGLKTYWRRRTVYAMRIAVNRFFSDTARFKSHAVEGDSRL